MNFDFDNLIEMEMAGYEPARGKSLLRALVALCLDAERHRAARPEIRSLGLDRRAVGAYNEGLRSVSTDEEELSRGEKESGAGEPRGGRGSAQRGAQTDGEVPQDSRLPGGAR